MKGSIQIIKEARDGSSEHHVDECNYVLSRSRAYLLSHLVDGSKPIDPIESFLLGKGGTPLANPSVPLSSSGTDVTGEMFSPLICENESRTRDPLYDRYRVEATTDGVPVTLSDITSSYPLKTTYEFYLDFDEGNGLSINEVGMITKSGSLFNHKTFATVTKTSELRLRFIWTLEYV